MVKKWASLILCLISSAYAGDATVVVLEAPMFRSPDVSADVVQYVHKGDHVYVHPVVLVDRTKYSEIQPSPEVWQRQPKEKDPMPIPENVANYHDGMDFILTKDNQGRDAWMLKEHVHVWYEDRREFAQKDPNPDPTDYRLLEPLPKTYPLIHKEKLRGFMGLSMGTPFSRAYPYNEKIVADKYGYQVEFNGNLMKQVESDDKGRWFVGGMITARTVESTYTLETRRATEQWTRVGGGVITSYDAWKNELNRITLNWAGLVYPFTQANISQTNPDTGEEEIRNYWGWNLTSRFGAQYQRVGLIADLDLILGVWGEVESPFHMQARGGTNRPTWWRGGNSDSFNTSVTFTLAGLVGIQSSY